MSDQPIDPCPDCGGFGRSWNLVQVGQDIMGNDENMWMLQCDHCGHVFQEADEERYDDYYYGYRP